MKIKNFIAPDISSAMDMVRQELGLDAVIISNETKNGEVYITAAVEEKMNFPLMTKRNCKSGKYCRLLMKPRSEKVWNITVF